jgi:monoterpene epsilon-lactone hydrolase
MSSISAKIIKKLIRYQLSSWSDGTIDQQRARQEKTPRNFRLPRDIKVESLNITGIEAEWVQAPGTHRGAILYLHGGAYSLGSIAIHRDFIARLAIATKMRCLAINYRLAPENPFPAALKDVTITYHWLLDQGFANKKIMIAGDSAGGGLSLATIISLRDAGETLPAGAICISPWFDLAMTGKSINEKAEHDPILSAASLKMYADYYAGERPTTDPLISPLYAELMGLPPILIQVGSDEILLSDAIRLTDKAKQSGVDVTLRIWDEMFHVFQLISFLPETRKALTQIAKFVDQYIEDETKGM